MVVLKSETALKKLIFVAGFSLALIGCASSGVQVSQEKASQFKIGIATEQDVIEALGKPTGFTSGVDGRSITYTGATAQIRAATFIPIVGIFAGGSDAKSSSTTFKFGKDGKLTNTITSGHTLSSGMGNGFDPSQQDQPRMVD